VRRGIVGRQTARWCWRARASWSPSRHPAFGLLFAQLDLIQGDSILKFLIGVGAQRCGTTWLHNYLAGHPAVFMSPFKELHVFDAMFAPEASGYTREKRFGELRGILLRMARGERVATNDLMIALERYDLSLGEENYLAHFRRHARPTHRVLGEITPSYSLIPASGFRHIRQFLVRAGMEPRIVYIMRDPLERLYSQLRFNERRGVARVSDSLASALDTPGIMLRTRYDLTLASLDSGFEPDEVLLLFYEELFQDSAIDSVCRFLDIDFRPADYAARINAAPVAGEIDPAFYKAARERLDVVYEFCADRFGRDRMRAIWKGF
jgi:hypothetical protein